MTFALKLRRTWAPTAAFLAGSIVLPQICHLVPQGGLIFLPIYFFTLVTAWAYGWQLGVCIAVAAPLLNNVLFGMPADAVLPVILMKGLLLVGGVALASRFLRPSLYAIAATVLIAQLAGCAIEQNFQDFVIGWPGMLLQIIGCRLMLRVKK